MILVNSYVGFTKKSMVISMNTGRTPTFLNIYEFLFVHLPFCCRLNMQVSAYFQRGFVRERSRSIHTIAFVLFTRSIPCSQLSLNKVPSSPGYIVAGFLCQTSSVPVSNERYVMYVGKFCETVIWSRSANQKVGRMG